MTFDILPECATAPAAAQLRYVWRSAVLAIFNVAALIGAIEGWPASSATPVLYLVFVVTLILAAYEFLQLLLALDEMQRSIHIGALGLAGAGLTGLATIWGVGALIFDIPAPHAVFAAPLFWLAYYAGLGVVARRFT